MTIKDFSKVNATHKAFYVIMDNEKHTFEYIKIDMFDKDQIKNGENLMKRKQYEEAQVDSIHYNKVLGMIQVNATI